MNISKLKNSGTKLILELLNKHEGKKGLMKVQRALERMGKDLAIDGIIGPITIAIIETVDNKKLHEIIYNLDKKLFKITSDINWLNMARNELGVKEIHGSKHNKRVLQYHAVSGGFSTDEVPWCGSFVNFVMLKAGHKGPKTPARAKSWLNFGKSSNVPIEGSIAVKSRKGGGHVCFVVGQDPTGKYLYCLGGNQHDEVNISKYKKSIFLDFRVPSNYNYVENNLPIYKGKAEAAGKES